MDTDKKSDQPESPENPDPQTDVTEGPAEKDGPLILESDTKDALGETESEETEADNPPEPDPESSIEPEPTPEPTPAPVPEPEQARSGGFGAALLGGVLAAILGFVVARTEILDPILPESWRTSDVSAQIEALESKVAGNADGLKETQDQIANIPQPDLSPIESGLNDLSARVDTLSGQLPDLSNALAGLEERLVSLEKRPVTEAVSPEAIAAYEAELDRLRDAVTTQRGEVEALLEEARALDKTAAAAARHAAAQTALARLRAALDVGAGFMEEADQIAVNGIEIPAALAEVASDGVATMASLRASFPPVARDALAQARAAQDTGEAQGLGAFLQRQLGARSVEPRDGNSADAVLSRAEAALTDGDLARALSEVETLPDAARPALAEWAANAKRRNDAVIAAAALAETLAKE